MAAGIPRMLTVSLVVLNLLGSGCERYETVPLPEIVTRQIDEQMLAAEWTEIEGTWTIVASEDGTHDAAPAVGRQAVIERGVMTIENDTWRFDLDPTRAPKEADLFKEGTTVPAIYVLDENKLTLCLGRYGTPRPTSFVASQSGGYQAMLVFERHASPAQAPDESISKK